MKKIVFGLTILIVSGFLISCGGGAEKAIPPSDSTSVDSSSSKILKDKGNGLFALAFNDLYFEVDVANAGRISAFSLGAKNILSGKEVNSTNWGTSLWPSPQSAWGWPPSKELDVKAYSLGDLTDTSIEVISEKDSLLGFVFKKNYLAVLTDSSVLVTYTIVNNSTKKQSVAPWEISRVAPGGLTLYPTGKGKKQNLLSKLMVDKNGITWFDYDSSKMNFKPSDVPKLMHDGAEGWIAQVSGNIILIKSFKDVSIEKTAPGEGEIEFYANPDKSYIEIEQQGEYTALESGKELQWQVKWYLRKLPEGMKAEVGSKELAEFVRATIK